MPSWNKFSHKTIVPRKGTFMDLGKGMTICYKAIDSVTPSVKTFHNISYSAVLIF